MPPDDDATPGLNPAALPLPDAARILARASRLPITEGMLRADLAAGAPANGDGTVNLVHYAAWLVAREGHGD
ncbi:hypothetical protein [Limnoglobus roseus]|uniref:Uncharacterized protein n=1 Tax=Limnoglobus roseus TaxID=2598579 RepID=A0A5C1AN82_9BACT|nr:hypothetical protein [Limnoglobus roseus]QEL20691.1 hypothetical protein PX52LOC_07798 [Limnoglobus roseus]